MILFGRLSDWERNLFHIYLPCPPSQLSIIEASPAWDGACGVHHRGARLQRPFPWASGRPGRATRLGRRRESTHTFIHTPVLLVSNLPLAVFIPQPWFLILKQFLNSNLNPTPKLMSVKKNCPHSESLKLVLRSRPTQTSLIAKMEAHKGWKPKANVAHLTVCSRFNLLPFRQEDRRKLYSIRRTLSAS